MRPGSLASLVALLLVGVAVAQSQPTRGRVKDRGVTVRSGPSEQMAETGKLDPGTEVLVVKLEGTDWYAIEPPRGSVSYIQALFVQPQGKPDPALGKLQPPFNAVVDAPDGATEVKIAAGHADGGKPLNVQRTTLPRGTIVQVIGTRVAVEADDARINWYPIAPPAGDLRYVPASGIDMIGGSTGQPGVVVKGNKPTSPEFGPLPVTPTAKATGDWPGVVASIPTPDANWPTNPQWREAEKARIDEDFARAEKLYLELAEKANRPDGDTKLADLCYSRIQMVRELADKKRGGAAAWRPGDVTTAAPTKTEEPAADKTEGKLKLVRWEYQNQQAYAVTSQEGKVRMYLVSSGVDLSKYVGKYVELTGRVSQPKETGGIGLMSVTRVDFVR